MRHLIGIAALAVALGACAHRKEKEPTPEERASQERHDAATGAASAVENFEHNKAAYLSRTENSVASLEAKIAAYKAAAPTDPTRREAYMANVASLEENLTNTKDKLEAVRGANINNWDQQQRQLEQSLLTTRAAYDAAAAAAH